MRSTVALEEKKGRERNNVIGPKFEDASTYFTKPPATDKELKHLTILEPTR